MDLPEFVTTIVVFILISFSACTGCLLFMHVSPPSHFHTSPTQLQMVSKGGGGRRNTFFLQINFSILRVWVVVRVFVWTKVATNLRAFEDFWRFPSVFLRVKVSDSVSHVPRKWMSLTVTGKKATLLFGKWHFIEWPKKLLPGGVYYSPFVVAKTNSTLDWVRVSLKR